MAFEMQFNLCSPLCNSVLTQDLLSEIKLLTQRDTQIK